MNIVLTNDALQKYIEINDSIHAKLCNLNISSIQPGLFKRLTFLKSLNINNNEIGGTIKYDTFDGLTSLEILDICNNSVSLTNPGNFTNLISLRELHLHNNHISLLNSSDFPTSLKLLNLSRNNITTLYQSGSFPTFLTSLNLGLNILSSIQPGQFENTSLSELNLSVNHIEYGNFNSFISLTSLNLSHNRITTIDSVIVDKLTSSLTLLNLCCNNITSLKHKLLDIPNLYAEYNPFSSNPAIHPMLFPSLIELCARRVLILNLV